MLGAATVVGDLRGDIEWIADGYEAAVFAAGARSSGELAAMDGGGAAERRRGRRWIQLVAFVCWRRHEQLVARQRQPLRTPDLRLTRLADLEVPWTILRFGGLTNGPNRAVRTMVDSNRSKH